MAFEPSAQGPFNAAPARSALSQPLLPPNFRFVTVTAVVLSASQRRRFRAAYNDNHSVLRDAVARNFGVSTHQLEGYQMHHWLPISLAPVINGVVVPHYSPNCIQNIDPVTAADHERFHAEIIDPQHAHLKTGDVVTLLLPKRHAKSRPRGGCKTEYVIGGGSKV